MYAFVKFLFWESIAEGITRPPHAINFHRIRYDVIHILYIFAKLFCL
jgi:hypothetical protein